MRCRNFLMDGRLHQIMVIRQAALAEPPDFNRFLDSFKLLGGLAKPGENDAPGAKNDEGDDIGGWKRLAPAGLGFSALFPEKPSEKVTTVSTPRGPGKMSRFAVDMGGFHYFVVYNSAPTDPNLDIPTALERARDGSMKALNVKETIDDREIALDDVAGREFAVKVPAKGGRPEAIYRARMFGTADGFYQAVVVVPTDSADAPEVKRFLDSFKLIKVQNRPGVPRVRGPARPSFDGRAAYADHRNVEVKPTRKAVACRAAFAFEFKPSESRIQRRPAHAGSDKPLARVFLLEQLLADLEQVAEGDDADKPIGIGRGDDRQPLDSFVRDEFGGVSAGLLGRNGHGNPLDQVEGDDRRVVDRLRTRRGADDRVNPTRHEVRTSDHAQQFARGVDHRITRVLAGVHSQEIIAGDTPQGEVRGDRHHVGRHHRADRHSFERIDGVFSADMKSSPRHLLGQDRPLHHQDGKPVRHRRRDQKCRQGVDVVLNSSAKTTLVKGERIVPPITLAMPIKGQSAAVAGQDRRDDRAQSAPHDQQRREHAAGGSRTERDRPNQPFDDDQPHKRADDIVAAQQLADDVIADAERRGSSMPPTPTAKPPIAGHHIQ